MEVTFVRGLFKLLKKESTIEKPLSPKRKSSSNFISNEISSKENSHSGFRNQLCEVEKCQS